MVVAQQFAEGSTTVDAQQQQAEEQGKHPAEVPGTLNRGDASDEAGVAGPALQLNRYDIEAGIWQGSVLYLTKAGVQSPVLQLQTAVCLQGHLAYADFLPLQKKLNCTAHIMYVRCLLAILLQHANRHKTCTCRDKQVMLLTESNAALSISFVSDHISYWQCLRPNFIMTERSTIVYYLITQEGTHAFLLSLIAAAVHGVLLL